MIRVAEAEHVRPRTKRPPRCVRGSNHTDRPWPVLVRRYGRATHGRSSLVRLRPRALHANPVSSSVSFRSGRDDDLTVLAAPSRARPPRGLTPPARQHSDSRIFPHSGASEGAHDDQVSDFLSTIDPLARTHPERAADANASSSQPRELPLTLPETPSSPASGLRISAALSGRGSGAAKRGGPSDPPRLGSRVERSLR